MTGLHPDQTKTRLSLFPALLGKTTATQPRVECQWPIADAMMARAGGGGMEERKFREGGGRRRREVKRRG
jgi:hypothetical protein